MFLLVQHLPLSGPHCILLFLSRALHHLGGHVPVWPVVHVLMNRVRRLIPVQWQIICVVTWSLSGRVAPYAVLAEAVWDDLMTFFKLLGMLSQTKGGKWNRSAFKSILRQVKTKCETIKILARLRTLKWVYSACSTPAPPNLDFKWTPVTLGQKYVCSLLFSQLYYPKLLW